MNIPVTSPFETLPFTRIMQLYHQNLLKRTKRRWVYASFIMSMIIITFLFTFWPFQENKFISAPPPTAMTVDLVTMPESRVSSPAEKKPFVPEERKNELAPSQEVLPQILAPHSLAPHPELLLKRHNKNNRLSSKHKPLPMNIKPAERVKTPDKSPEKSVAPSKATSPTQSSPSPVKTSASLQPFHDKISWQAALLSHLEKFKRYPASAMARGQEGVPMVRFSIDRQGHVLNTKLIKSSDYTTLDEEALSLPERAQPLPPPPATIKGDQITLTVPVEFSVHQD